MTLVKVSLSAEIMHMIYPLGLHGLGLDGSELCSSSDPCTRMHLWTPTQ